VRPPLILLAASVAGVLPVAGCSESDPPVPTGPQRAVKQTRAYEFERAGMTLRLPANIEVTRQRRLPAVFRGYLQQPFVSGYAYRRAEQLPRNERELQDARRRLVSTTQGRDRTYELTRSRATEIGGNRAVELLGEQVLGRTRLRIRSMHVYRGSAEYVIEVGAPRRQFARFDRAVTPVVKRSLKVTGRVARRN
jgi:hypothetical protein